MDWKVEFSPEANFRAREIITYLSNEWSQSTARKFVEILHNKIQNIKTFPRLYPTIDGKTKVRKCVVTKQIILYYRIKKKTN